MLKLLYAMSQKKTGPLWFSGISSSELL